MPHAGPRAPVDMNPFNPIGQGRLPQLYNPNWQGLAAPILGRYGEQANQANHSNSEWSRENQSGQWSWKSNPLGAFFYPKRYEEYQASLQPQGNHSGTRNGPAPIPLGGQNVRTVGGPAPIPLVGPAPIPLGGPEMGQVPPQSQAPLDNVFGGLLGGIQNRRMVGGNSLRTVGGEQGGEQGGEETFRIIDGRYTRLVDGQPAAPRLNTATIRYPENDPGGLGFPISNHGNAQSNPHFVLANPESHARFVAQMRLPYYQEIARRRVEIQGRDPQFREPFPEIYGG